MPSGNTVCLLVHYLGHAAGALSDLGRDRVAGTELERIGKAGTMRVGVELKAEHIKNGALALLAAAGGAAGPSAGRLGYGTAELDFLHGGGLPHRYAGSGGVPALRQDGERRAGQRAGFRGLCKKAGELAAVLVAAGWTCCWAVIGPGPR